MEQEIRGILETIIDVPVVPVACLQGVCLALPWRDYPILLHFCPIKSA